jgi:5-methylthioadenosine/S-adenosylhomocysteine deaminase
MVLISHQRYLIDLEAAVGERSEILGRFTAGREIGDDNAIVLPGMIDAHTHCTQCFVRSVTAGELPMIPRIYNPAQRALSPEQAGATVRLLAAQLIRSGITTLCEGTLNPLHEDAIVEALQDVGLRCTMARGAADQDFHHAALYAQINDKSWVKAREGEAEKDLRRTEDFLMRFPSSGDGLIRGAVNASALPGFSESYFKQGSALARQYGTTLQVHVSRDREEVEFCLSLWGCRPIEHLEQLGVVDSNLVAAHAVLASEAEISILAQAKACLAHSPMECINNLNAVPNIQRFRSAGIRVALGCDNQGNDMFTNMRAAWLIHGALWGIPRYDPEYLSTDDLLSMATREAAEVLRWDDRTGSIEAGKAADLVVMDGNAPHLMAQQHLPTELVRYASRAEIRQTIVDGRILYDDGVYTTVDLERLRAESAAGAAQVREAVSDRRYRPLATRP